MARRSQKRGRPRESGPPTTDLAECVKNGAAVTTGRAYMVFIDGVRYYVWTSSVANAVRDVALHHGIKAVPVGPQEVYAAIEAAVLKSQESKS